MSVLEYFRLRIQQYSSSTPTRLKQDVRSWRDGGGVLRLTIQQLQYTNHLAGTAADRAKNNRLGLTYK